VVLRVEQGETVTSAAEKLKAAGLIPSTTPFVILARIFGPHKALKAGKYHFYPSESWQQHLMRMQ
jgi:cell division protein YceG involved in septum cleavage